MENKEIDQNYEDLKHIFSKLKKLSSCAGEQFLKAYENFRDNHQYFNEILTSEETKNVINMKADVIQLIQMVDLAEVAYDQILSTLLIYCLDLGMQIQRRKQ